MECVNWRKSLRSSGNGENCVEIANLASAITVRDSKDPDGPRLTFGLDVFRAFVAEVKSR